MQSVGYKETCAFLEGKLSREQLVAEITQNTLRLAKQQSTWFRGEELAEWLTAPYRENLYKTLGL